MSLLPGTRLGSYEIVSAIGAGGMGEVYKAHDTTLNRDVAIKVLPDAFASDAERLGRFTREAQTLAALNHPNIAHIHGLETSGRVRALVMELVDGEDLSAHIARGPMPVADAAPIAKQLAEALEAAHDLGIIHRDLKPANIKVKTDGTVKVLDFGLAKALDANASNASADAMNSPTLTARATQLGVILGTAAYMAPEQAKGKAVDRRADIWAFGCVLYEMLAGRRIFQGDDVSETLASVLRAEVDWSALPKDTPKPLVDLLRRCLERDIRQRLQAIGEARILLGQATGESTRSDIARASGVQMSSAKRATSWILIAAAATAGVAATLAVTRPWRSAAAPGAVRKFLLATDAAPDNVAISPDGRRLLLIAGTKLQVRELDQLQPREVPGVGPMGTGDNAPNPAWSSDGASIVYGAGGKIWRIGLAGGSPTLICDSPGVFRGAAWKPDGTIVLSTVRGPLFQVSANGGEPRVLLPLNGKDDVDFHDPFVLPDGQSLLYSVHRQQGVDTIEAWSAGKRTVLMRLEGRAREGPQVLNSPAYSSGHLVYRLEQGNAGVWAVPFSLSALKTTGEPFLVAAGGTWPSVASDGTLAYAAAEASGPRQFAWFRPDGSIDRLIGEPRKLLRQPRLSPDGRRIAFLADDQNTDVWVSNVDGSGAARITFTPDNEADVTWIPNQNAVAFFCPKSGGGAICTKNADGSGETKELADQAGAPIFSSDGSALLYSTSGSALRGLLSLDLRAPGAKPREFFLNAETMYPLAILAGNKFAVFWGYSSGRPLTFLKPFPTGDSKWEVTGLSADFPKVLPGGKVIGALVRSPDGHPSLVTVPFETSPAVTFGPRKELFTGLPELLQVDAGFDLNADGTRLLAVMPKSTGPVQRGIVVVLNWLAEFQKH